MKGAEKDGGPSYREAGAKLARWGFTKFDMRAQRQQLKGERKIIELPQS